MSAAQHTPGPWQVTWNGPHTFVETDWMENDETIEIFGAASEGRTQSEREANARLTAAAPAMFNALTLLLATEPDDASGMADVYADAKAAIAIARGRA